MPQRGPSLHNFDKTNPVHFITAGRSLVNALVINGPNINMVGIREPNIYGRETYDDLVRICKEAGSEFGFDDVEVFQSNHEGSIIDRIQDAYGTVDGIVINPAAYTHTSIGILDALKAVSIPAVEVSYAGMACFARVAGEGLAGYRHALQLLADHLK